MVIWFLHELLQRCEQRVRQLIRLAQHCSLQLLWDDDRQGQLVFGDHCIGVRTVRSVHHLFPRSQFAIVQNSSIDSVLGVSVVCVLCCAVKHIPCSLGMQWQGGIVGLEKIARRSQGVWLSPRGAMEEDHLTSWVMVQNTNML